MVVAKAKKSSEKKKSDAKADKVKLDSQKKTPVKKVKKTKPRRIVQRDWYLFDCSKEPLGRAATKIASLLIGKNRLDFKPYLDQGDYVVVINAAKVFLTGKKMEQKVYFHHTGFPGAIKCRSFKDLLQRKPEWLVFQAVKGMLPKNHLGMRMIRRLKVYRDENHPYSDKVKVFN